jgi:hypothetical protein
MIWLERLNQDVILDVLVIPYQYNDDILLSRYCALSGTADPGIIAVGTIKEDYVWKPVHMAWTVDFKNEKFEEIPSKDVMCQCDTCRGGD